MSEKEGFEIKVNYVLGVLGLVLLLYNPWLGLMSSLMCLILGRKDSGLTKKLGTWGLILNLVAIVLIVVAGVLLNYMKTTGVLG